MSDVFPRVAVNGRVLPPQSIEFELARLITFYSQHMPEEQVRAQMGDLRQKAIDQAIGARLLLEEALRLKMAVPGQEIETRLAELRQQAGGAARFEALLRKQKLTESGLRAQIELGRRVDKLVEQVTGSVPEPTEEDLQAHYAAHEEAYARAERSQAQHILIKPGTDDDAGRKAACEKLEAIRERVQGGASFADEAAAHSECPSGRQSGGSLGWFSRGMMVEAFDRAVFDMAVGELSGIVETPFGLHLIYKTAHEPAKAANYDEARESIRDFLRHAARGSALSAFVAKLRDRAKVEIA